MPFVSCRYAPPPEREDDQQMIICTDENGQEWSVPPDCGMGDWLRFKEGGGEIEPYEPPEEPA